MAFLGVGVEIPLDQDRIGEMGRIVRSYVQLASIDFGYREALRVGSRYRSP